jgi:hypothetical protein
MDPDPLDRIQQETFAGATEATRESYPPERRIFGEALRSYLDRRVFAVVSSTRPDGRPHAALTSYVRQDAAFFLPTVAGSVRERNLRTQPWLVLVVAEGDHDEHIAVIVEGPGVAMAAADVPPGVAATAPESWVSSWLRLDAERLLSYAAESARVS